MEQNEMYETQAGMEDSSERLEKKEQLRAKVQALVSYYEDEKRRNEELTMELERLKAEQQQMQSITGPIGPMGGPSPSGNMPAMPGGMPPMNGNGMGPPSAVPGSIAFSQRPQSAFPPQQPSYPGMGMSYPGMGTPGPGMGAPGPGMGTPGPGMGTPGMPGMPGAAGPEFPPQAPAGGYTLQNFGAQPGFGAQPPQGFGQPPQPPRPQPNPYGAPPQQHPFAPAFGQMQQPFGAPPQPFGPMGMPGVPVGAPYPPQAPNAGAYAQNDGLSESVGLVMQTITQVRAKLHQFESIRGYGYPQQPAYVDVDTVALLDKLYDQLGDLTRELMQRQGR